MKIILKETIDSLGIIGSELTVADGYARNYLFPQNKAVKATPKNRRMLEQVKVKVDLQIAKEKSFAEEMAKRLDGVVCKIVEKVSNEGKLYGSVIARDIVNALAAQDIQLEKKMILLSEPIKAIGTYQIPVRIYRDVEPQITVEIASE